MRPPRLTPLAAALLHVPGPERALVIGSADGEAVLLLAREFPAARIRGVDPRPDLVRAASARVGLDPEARVAFKVGAPRSLPYPDAFFDLVVQVDSRPAVGEIARALKPGGRLILARSRVRRFAPGLRHLLLRRWLAHGGIDELLSESAGDGNFFVGQLDPHR